MAEQALRKAPSHWRDFAPILILLACFAALPPIAQALGQPFLIKVGVRILVFAIAASALNFALGFGGMVSLMHAGLFGLGGYALAIMAANDFNGETLKLGFTALPGSSNFIMLVLLAMLVAGLGALLMGAVSLRTSGSYFIMITLAFNQMLYYAFVGWQTYGGEDGLQLLGALNAPGLNLGDRNTMFYLSLAALAVVLVFLQLAVDSRFGMALRGAAQNEQRMQAIGVSPYPYKLTAFVISGAIAGLAGALQAASQNFISPTDMFWGRSGDLVVICVLGGVARVWGPVIGAALFFTLELSLGAMTKSWELPFGLIVIALATFANGGIIELLARLGLIQRVRVGGQH